jgi:hypothetical protein
VSENGVFDDVPGEDLQVSWSEIESYIFINARDGFVAECEGVPLEHIRECERGLGIVFPQVYVDFLSSMGVSAGDYHPFGRRYDHGFHALLGCLEDAEYPTRQYFLVAVDPDQDTEGTQEPYLDLGRAAHGDAPLVTMAYGMPFAPQYVRDLRYTLAERLASIAMLNFGLARPCRKTLSGYQEGLATLTYMRDHVMAILRNIGLKIELSPSPFLACMENAELAAGVQITGEKKQILAVDLAGYDDRQVRRAAEILLDALPDLSEMQTWMPDD